MIGADSNPDLGGRRRRRKAGSKTTTKTTATTIITETQAVIDSSSGIMTADEEVVEVEVTKVKLEVEPAGSPPPPLIGEGGKGDEGGRGGRPLQSSKAAIGIGVSVSFLLPMLTLVTLALKMNGGSKYVRLLSTDGCETRWMELYSCRSSLDFICCSSTGSQLTEFEQDMAAKSARSGAGGGDRSGGRGGEKTEINKRKGGAGAEHENETRGARKKDEGSSREMKQQKGRITTSAAKGKVTNKRDQQQNEDVRSNVEGSGGDGSGDGADAILQLEVADLCNAARNPMTKWGTTFFGSITACLVTFLLNVLGQALFCRKLRRAHARRALLYVFMIFFRVLVLYKLLDVLEDALQDEVKECWYSAFRWKGKCAEHFDVADHVVLGLGQIVPIQMFETFSIFREWKSPLALIIIVTPALVITAICYQSVFETINHFHSRTESAAGIALSLLCVWLPLCRLMSSSPSFPFPPSSSEAVSTRGGDGDSRTSGGGGSGGGGGGGGGSSSGGVTRTTKKTKSKGTEKEQGSKCDNEESRKTLKKKGEDVKGKGKGAKKEEARVSTWMSYDTYVAER